MQTVLTLLLVRFALIVGVIVVIAALVLTVALVLKRKGKLASAKQKMAPAARGAAQLLADRGGESVKGRVGSAMLGAAAQRLSDDRSDDQKGPH